MDIQYVVEEKTEHVHFYNQIGTCGDFFTALCSVGDLIRLMPDMHYRICIRNDELNVMQEYVRFYDGKTEVNPVFDTKNLLRVWSTGTIIE